MTTMIEVLGYIFVVFLGILIGDFISNPNNFLIRLKNFKKKEAVK